MNDALQQLQATLAAMRAELDETKARLAKIEKVITFDEASDGKEVAYIECADLIVRQRSDRRFFAVHLGSTESGGYVDVHYPGAEHASKTAIGLSIGDDGQPHIQLRGLDHKIRADVFIEEDFGTMAVLGPGHTPGAVMRARPGGGSVSVLQPDGRARAVLVHDEQRQDGDSGTVAPATELIFATADAKTVLKLHGNANGGLICVGQPGQPPGALMMSRNNGNSVMLHSPAKQTSVCIVATDAMARIAAHQGLPHERQAEASLSAGTFGGSVTLHECDGAKRIDLMAAKKGGTIHLLDDEEEPAVSLSHRAGAQSVLAMRGTADHDCVRILSDQNLTAVSLASPTNPDSGFLTTVQQDKSALQLQRDKHPCLFLTEGEHGGVITAAGIDPEKAGLASLGGGPVTGCVSVATADGTNLVTLDGTDHGGRLLINNDLGFQRIAMGVHAESAALHLNHTGQYGVQAAATSEGGLICVRDAEGKPIDGMPRGNDDDDDSARWGKLPGSD